MNRLAELIEVEDRLEEMRARICRQEAIIVRLRQIDALPCVMREAERLRRALTSNLVAVLERRDGLAVALEKCPLDSVLGAMQIGLLGLFWTVEDLAEGAQ